ncbi:hypothetical protein SAMN05920897_1376 [Alkalispirochaeta americana]|uniref:Uncharacterized protein n=1 Tax=Alkalispirochaeta americana TaxID=159291 RepID=A0A1N6Y2Y4_9SPIO|nr:hypothetical protein SAMN05920897_1376 [Alkalispirochaeta americana]
MDQEREDLCSLTVKGISTKSKENFSLFCALQGRSMQEVIRDFINSVQVPHEGAKNYMMFQTVINILSLNKGLIDSFILEQEPMYNYLDQDQKDASRQIFCSMNPSYIYKKYIDWLDAK